jgi:hypothetical protein
MEPSPAAAPPQVSATAACEVDEAVAGMVRRLGAQRGVHNGKLPSDLPPLQAEAPPDEEPERDEPLEPATPPEQPVPVWEMPEKRVSDALSGRVRWLRSP